MRYRRLLEALRSYPEASSSLAMRERFLAHLAQQARIEAALTEKGCRDEGTSPDLSLDLNRVIAARSRLESALARYGESEGPSRPLALPGPRPSGLRIASFHPRRAFLSTAAAALLATGVWSLSAPVPSSDPIPAPAEPEGIPSARAAPVPEAWLTASETMVLSPEAAHHLRRERTEVILAGILAEQRWPDPDAIPPDLLPSLHRGIARRLVEATRPLDERLRVLNLIRRNPDARPPVDRLVAEIRKFLPEPDRIEPDTIPLLALTAYEAPDGARSLLKIARHREDLRDEALRLLTKTAVSRAPLREALRDPRLRESAFRVASGSDDPVWMAALVDALDDPRLRGDAAVALAAIDVSLPHDLFCAMLDVPSDGAIPLTEIARRTDLSSRSGLYAAVRRRADERDRFLDACRRQMTRLARAGDPASVPCLVDALARPRLSRAAREALVSIAGTDLGPDPERWMDWYRKGNHARGG